MLNAGRVDASDDAKCWFRERSRAGPAHGARGRSGRRGGSAVCARVTGNDEGDGCREGIRTEPSAVALPWRFYRTAGQLRTGPFCNPVLLVLDSRFINSPNVVCCCSGKKTNSFRLRTAIWIRSASMGKFYGYHRSNNFLSSDISCPNGVESMNLNTSNVWR